MGLCQRTGEHLCRSRARGSSRASNSEGRSPHPRRDVGAIERRPGVDGSPQAAAHPLRALGAVGHRLPFRFPRSCAGQQLSDQSPKLLAGIVSPVFPQTLGRPCRRRIARARPSSFDSASRGRRPSSFIVRSLVSVGTESDVTPALARTVDAVSRIFAPSGEPAPKVVWNSETLPPGTTHTCTGFGLGMTAVLGVMLVALRTSLPRMGVAEACRSDVSRRAHAVAE